jgi:hypothetical protein
MPKKYQSFKAFYPYYLTEHQNFTCRMLHFVGTGLVLCLLLIGLFTLNWKFLVAMPFAGYGFAWLGHAFFEKNKPATFTYPRYSLIADFKLFFDILTGQLPKKMAEAKRLIEQKNK